MRMQSFLLPRVPLKIWVVVLVMFHLELSTSVHICPAPTACYCFFNREIDCRQFDLKNIPQFDRENITFDSIDLGENRFREIKADAFKELRVRQINLWENKRSLTLDRDTFVGVGDYLEYLELARNREIVTIPAGLFRPASKLVVIDMPKNHLKHLPPFAFTGATSVQLLDLQKNDLTSIADNTFRGLLSIEELLLSENNVSSLGSRSFLGMRNLRELYLDKNFIRDLPPNAFRSLKALRILDLSHNMISSLFPIMLRGMKRLEMLDLTNNAIELIADNAFQSMSSLLELTMDKAKLTFLRPGMFKGLVSLRELSLVHNNIQILENDLFKSMGNLWKLYVENNQLTTVNPCAFADISKMKSISIHNNPIHCDCTMSWVTRETSPDVLGKCTTPDSEKETDIKKSERYRVCTFSGIEECSSELESENNEALRLWLRFRRRVYRHAPSLRYG